MFPAALTWLQFAALFAGVSAGVVALYLWDRSKRRVRVATLRFWDAAEHAPAARRRRRIHQPLSLALQLIGIALLLLALAQLRWGAPGAAPRNHVVLLDTSAWMGAATRHGTLEDEARRAAWTYIRGLPSSDRVMLMRADALATPATPFEQNRRELERAIAGSRPGSTALNLQQAVAAARRAQRLQDGPAGEIVYAGAGRVADSPADLTGLAGIRVLPVRDTLENCGLRRIGLRRSTADSAVWQVLVGVRNYGSQAHPVTLALSLDGARVGSRPLTLAAGSEQDVSFEVRTQAAARLEASLSPGDAYPADDRAALDLPAEKPLRVLVYSERPDELRPALSSRFVQAEYRPPSDYRAGARADLIILDHFSPPMPPASNSIWIEPPAAGAPVRVRGTVTRPALASWHVGHPIAAGLAAKDLRLENAEVLEPDPGDSVVAEIEQGPVIVARDRAVKMAVLGFQPARGASRYALTTPLLFANLLRWMAPDVFRRWQLDAGTAGMVRVPLGENIDSAQVRVSSANGAPLPYTVQGGEVRFFAAEPGAVSVDIGDRRIVYSLLLPEVAENHWQVGPANRRGLPAAHAIRADFIELWPWLAAAGMLALLIEWLRFGRQGAPRRRLALALKLATLALAILALLQPELAVFDSRVAVAVLADTSASIPDSGLAESSRLAGSIRAARSRNWLHVLPFAASVRPLSADEQKNARIDRTEGPAANATDLENAVREGLTALPSGRVPRLALISDGKENVGSLARAAWQARQLGVPVDVFPLAGRPRPQLNLESVSVPSQAFTGERFPVDLVVRAPQAARASVEITAAGKRIGSNQLDLEPGDNHLRVHASLASAGVVDVGGSIGTQGLGTVRFAEAVALERPRVLLVSQDPPGTGMPLLRALQAGQFEVTQTSSIPSTLDDYQMLVLNNWNLEAVPRPTQTAIEKYVKAGGGLLVIGGEHNVYVDRRAEDPLDRALPARLVPPRTPEGTCVVLILDKSSSMEGRKIELARLAAVGVVENLRPTDYVGVLIFDNSFHWAVPIRTAADRDLIERVISGITPDGGTQIAPALQEAYRRILPVHAVSKHIVLLTDGISEEGDSLALAREAGFRRVTISTVGLGQDVNRSYLEKVANLAGGRSYFLNDPGGLEQILLRDVMEHAGSTAVERSFRPQALRKAEVLEGVGIETAPPLLGYVRFAAKPTSEVLLDIDRQDPLFIRWQCGLGRAAVFTSDAKSRWARAWVGWPGFDRFWQNVFRDLLPHAGPGEARADYDAATDVMQVDYRLGREADEPLRPPDLFAFGPGGFERPVPLEKVAEGAWRGRVRLDHRQGLFRVRPLEESRTFPEVGLYRSQAELADFGSNPELLKQVAAFTGGRFNPPPGDVFDSGGRRVPAVLRLWPALLALALLLSLLELVLRKRSRRPAGSESYRLTVTVSGSTS